jgi:hypothetical protein
LKLIGLEASGKIGQDAVFVLVVLGGKGDTKADVSACLIPRDGGDKLLLD